MREQSDRMERIENEVYGNGQPGLKDRLVRVEESVKDLPALKKRIDINTILTATTLALVVRPNVVDALDWLFKLLHL